MDISCNILFKKRAREELVSHLTKNNLKRWEYPTEASCFDSRFPVDDRRFAADLKIDAYFFLGRFVEASSRCRPAEAF